MSSDWLQVEIPHSHSWALTALVVLVIVAVVSVPFPVGGAEAMTKRSSYVLGAIAGLGGWGVSWLMIKEIATRYYMEDD
jgi:hypothetical protein